MIASLFCPKVMVVFFQSISNYILVLLLVLWSFLIQIIDSLNFIWPFMDLHGFLEKSTEEAISSIHKINDNDKITLPMPAKSWCSGQWSILLSKLRLSAVVDAHIPNHETQKHMKDLIAVKIDDAEICF